MTIEAPKWLQSANIIKVEDREHELRPDCLLRGLKDEADTSEKENFEKEMNKLLAKVAKLVFPEMEKPYYKWTGEVIDRVRNDGDDEGRWITTENGHKIFIDESGEPTKGNPHVLEAISDWKEQKSTQEKERPKNKQEAAKRIEDIAKSSKSESEKVEELEKNLSMLPIGTKIKMPDSWEDDNGKIPEFVFDGSKWESKTKGWGSASQNEMAMYFNTEDDAERPKIASMPKPQQTSDNGAQLRNILDQRFGGDYDKASLTGKNANINYEQYRFFGGYMHGVGYGTESHEAFNSYNYHGDGLINGMIRGSTPKNMSQQKEWVENEERTRKYIDQMTQAIDENPLRKSACVYRGISKKSSLSKMLGIKIQNGVDIEDLYDNGDFLESLIGHTFSDPGFASTSIDPDFPSDGGFDKACRMEIFCPAGTKGTYFGDALKLTDEHEYLLQRGTQFVITGVNVEEKPYGEGKRLLLNVAVVNQQPQDIPELKKLYEPNKRIVEATEKEERISESELREMYSGLSKGALEDVIKARDGDKNEAWERVTDLLTEEAYAGNISPEQAGELEAYAMRIKDIGSRIDPHVFQDKQKLVEGHPEFKPNLETIRVVSEEYPDATEDVVERIATMRTMADHYRERAKRDKEMYGEGIITKKLEEHASQMKKSEEYAIRAYRAAKER